MKDPEWRKYKFMMDNIMKMIQDKELEDVVKAGLHAGEFFLGVLLTIFAPEAAVPYWIGVGVAQLAEIPIDEIKDAETNASFVDRWYGTPPNVWTYLSRRDKYEQDENSRESREEDIGFIL
jgi:hypothetical protein